MEQTGLKLSTIPSALSQWAPSGVSRLPPLRPETARRTGTHSTADSTIRLKHIQLVKRDTSYSLADNVFIIEQILDDLLDA